MLSFSLIGNLLSTGVLILGSFIRFIITIEFALGFKILEIFGFTLPEYLLNGPYYTCIC